MLLGSGGDMSKWIFENMHITIPGIQQHHTERKKKKSHSSTNSYVRDYVISIVNSYVDDVIINRNKVVFPTYSRARLHNVSCDLRL